MVITNAKIVLPNKVIEKGYIEIFDKKIKKVAIGEYNGADKDIYDAKGCIVMPGFIDIHSHGSMGIDFMTATVEDYKIIADSLYKEGTTSFLATTVTASVKDLAYVAKTVAKAKKENPSLLGIHYEGPYIALKYKGAQNEKFIQAPNIEDFNKLYKYSKKALKYITLAPEKENAIEFIRNAKEHNVVCAAGHTDASFKDIELAIDAGLTSTTHLHNAMSGHHHRNPGVVTAAFYFDKLYTEMICDGIHVNKDVVKTTYKIVGPDRFMIITDALSAKHTDTESFVMGGLDVIKKDGAAYLTSGPLAGSLLSMDQGVRNLFQYTNADLIGLAKASSTNQAKLLNLKDRGVIKTNKLADLVILNNDLMLVNVFKEGKKVV